MIGILDYGMANLRSVQNAFARVGHPAEVIASAEQVKRCDRLVLPGVGAFKDAMATLRRGGLDAAIVDHVDADGRSWASAWACRCCSTSASRTANGPGSACSRASAFGSTSIATRRPN